MNSHQDSVLCIAVCPSREPPLLISGDCDDKAILWELREQNPVILQTLSDHSDSVIAVAFNHNGTLCATASMDGKVLIYKVIQAESVHLEPLHCLEGPDQEIEWIRWHSRGNVILAGASDSSTWMWNGQSAEWMGVFTGAHSGAVLTGSFTGDGKRVVTCGEEGSAVVWNPKNGNILHQIRTNAMESPIVALDCHSSLHIAACGCEDGGVYVFSTANGKVLNTVKAPADIGKVLEDLGVDGTEGAEEEREVELPQAPGCESVVFDSGLNYLAAGFLTGEIMIWDVNSGRIRGMMKHSDAVTKMEWVSSGVLVSAGTDGVLCLWNARSAELIHSWECHTEAILDFVVVSSDSVIITTGDDAKCAIVSYGKLLTMQ